VGLVKFHSWSQLRSRIPWRVRRGWSGLRKQLPYTKVGYRVIMEDGAIDLSIGNNTTTLEEIVAPIIQCRTGSSESRICAFSYELIGCSWGDGSGRKARRIGGAIREGHVMTTYVKITPSHAV